MIGLDTNVILRALVDVGHPHHDTAKELFSGLTEDEPGFIARVALVELY